MCIRCEWRDYKYSYCIACGLFILYNASWHRCRHDDPQIIAVIETQQQDIDKCEARRRRQANVEDRW